MNHHQITQHLNVSHNIENEEINALLLSYYRYLQNSSSKLIIHGLSVVAKEEQTVRHTLRNAFVPLTVHPIADHGAQLSESGEDWRGNATDVLRQCPLLVLRGHAGCGKTTLMQWYITHCDPSLKEEDPASFLAVAPIYVPLRRLEAKEGFDWSVPGLMSAAVANESLAKSFTFDWIKKATKAGNKLAFLLDGVDEISEEHRERFWELVLCLLAAAPNARIVVTSRHLSAVHLSSGAYRDIVSMSRTELQRARLQWAIPDGFLEFVMSPLNNNEIINFIRKWHSGIDPKILPDEDRRQIDEYANDLILSVLYDDESNALDLCRTPLLCGLLCLVHFIREGRLPNSRRELYEISTKILTKIRDEHRHIVEGSDYGKIDLDARLGLLRHIALTMQEGANNDSDGQTIEVEKTYVQAWVRKWLDEHSFDELNADFVLDKLIERSNLLREPIHGKIDFLHRSFMEFLAANEMVLKREPYSVRRYIEHDQWWSTLQFCMDTETGGIFFAGTMIEIFVDYIINNQEDPRSLLMKTAQLLPYTNEIPVKSMKSLETIVKKIFPPKNWDEVEILMSFPYRSIEEIFRCDNVRKAGDILTRRRCVALLSRHPDNRCRELIMTGFQDEIDSEIIELVNKSYKITIQEHRALIPRMKNDSYKKTVHIRFVDLDNDILEGLAPSKICIRCEEVPDGLQAWSFARKAGWLRLENAAEAHWAMLEKNKKKNKFKKIWDLEIYNCRKIDGDLISCLFPNVRKIRLERCEDFAPTGLEKAGKLEDLRVMYHRENFAMNAESCPMNLRSLHLVRSIDSIQDEEMPSGLRIERGS